MLSGYSVKLSACETVCKITKPKLFTIWPFLEKSFWYLFFETRLSVHMKHRGKAHKLNNHDEAVRQIQNIGNFSNVSILVKGAQGYLDKSDESDMAIKFTVNFSSERVTGKKARGLQTEKIDCKCQTFFYLLLK